MTSRLTLPAFSAYGIELEYMIVDRETLDVQPIADRLLREFRVDANQGGGPRVLASAALLDHGRRVQSSSVGGRFGPHVNAGICGGHHVRRHPIGSILGASGDLIDPVMADRPGPDHLVRRSVPLFSLRLAVALNG